MKKISIVLFITVLSITLACAQPYSQKAGESSIKWMSIQEGMKIARQKHLNVLVDCYTDWCGWCKKMDNETFADKKIVDYMGSNFVAVKLNAESKDPITFNEKNYVNQNPAANRSPHQLAIELLGGSLSYPTYVYLDEKGTIITLTKGYMQAEDMLPILKYIGSNSYLKMSWKEFNDKQ